jgi:TnpA family transposase
MDKELQQDIREGCNRAEFWNKFQDAIFCGKGGVISSNNPKMAGTSLENEKNAIGRYRNLLLWRN